MKAAGAAYSRLVPGISIEWTVRSLHAFEATPLSELAADYDILALDHPFIGSAVLSGILRPLDGLIDAQELAARADDSAGLSHASYQWDGRQWAVAADAACMVGAVRDDLLPDTTAPTTWADAIRLAAKLGPERVLVAANPTHLLGMLLCLCEAVSSATGRQADGRPLWWGDDGIDRTTLLAALEQLSTVLSACSEDSLRTDPIEALARLAGDDAIAYVPLVFGYVTYAHAAAGRHAVRFINAPRSGREASGTLTGGVGLALSAFSRHDTAVADFLRYVTDREIQRTLFTAAGGQPGRRSAWVDEESNALANDFFTGTLSTMTRSFLRPRTAGYPRFQVNAAYRLHELFLLGAAPETIADVLQELWEESLLVVG